MAAGDDFDYLQDQLGNTYGSIEEAKAYRRAAKLELHYQCENRDCRQPGSVDNAKWKTVVSDCGNRKAHGPQKPCYNCGRMNALGATHCVGRCGKPLAPHHCGDCKQSDEHRYHCPHCGRVTVVETQGNGIGFTHQTPFRLDD